MINHEEPLRRYHRVFSGKQSKTLWKDIDRMKRGRTRWALYSLGCKCQELEELVRRLERRIAQLEDK